MVYYRCGNCSCILTTFFDRWSALDFKRFIYNRDYELVDPEFGSPRAARLATELARLLDGCGGARILAYGPGAAAVAAEIDRLGLVLHFGTERYGFLQPGAEGAAAAALARLGPIGVQLGAPAEDQEGWNGSETSHLGTRFRWTRAAEITWPWRRLRRGATRIRIPYVHQIYPDFARNSRLFFGDMPLPTEATANAVTGLIELAADREDAVRLVTPAPKSPSELFNSPDARWLGLAIPISC